MFIYPFEDIRVTEDIHKCSFSHFFNFINVRNIPYVHYTLRKMCNVMLWAHFEVFSLIEYTRFEGHKLYSNYTDVKR